MTNFLLVDDSSTIRTVLKNILPNLIIGDLTMYEAENGKEALDVLKEKGPVDFVLLDLNMPEMSGDKFLEVFRSEERNNSTRVIMITTEAEKRTVKKMMKLGVNGYIVKPFRPSLIQKKLQPILERMGVIIKRQVV